jgi:putative phage-type endonuclease
MDYRSDISSIIEIYMDENEMEYLDKEGMKELVEYIYESLKTHYEININKKQIEIITHDLFETLYFPKEKEHNTPIKDIEQVKYDKLEEHYDYLLNLPQPEQKSKEWFDMRNNMITASSGAAALGESKYDTLESFIYEKVFGREFNENKFVHHGKKYEHIATMLYQHIYNVKVGEFGLLRHPNIDFIGASPDGICSAYTLDGKRGSPLLGTMVEIKCPMTREIKTSGDVKDGICPYYYWVQVQLQLQCCDLQRCDFIQLNIKEYESQDEFMNDDWIPSHTENQNMSIVINKKWVRNAVIQLLPIYWTQKVKFEKREWYSKYLYPPSLDMTKEEILEWIDSEKQKFSTSEHANKYKFDKPLFFKVVSSHNTIIMREDSWFEQSLPKLKETWEKIKFFRSNKEASEKFKEEYNSKRKPKVEFVPKNKTNNNDGFIDTE